MQHLAILQIKEVTRYFIKRSFKSHRLIKRGFKGYGKRMKLTSENKNEVRITKSGNFIYKKSQYIYGGLCEECGEPFLTNKYSITGFCDKRCVRVGEKNHNYNGSEFSDTKICTKCGIEKPNTVDFFHKNKNCKYGLRSICKICMEQYRGDNSEEIKKRQRHYYINNNEQVKQKSNQYYCEHSEQRKQYQRRYGKNNRGKVNAFNARYRARRTEQTPPDANLEKIQFIYEICSTMKGYEVDHYHPLSKGGLHHPNNLQILRADLNREKSAKWPLTPEEQIKYKGWRL